MASKGLLSPDQALLESSALPLLAACEHFAGTSRFIEKALRLRRESGLRFDVTCDCEDGAASGQEQTQLQMILDTLTAAEFRNERVGVRVHETLHPLFQVELEAVISTLRAQLLYITVPKILDLADAQRAITAARNAATKTSLQAPALHLLIETHGALRDVAQIAQLEGVEAIDFGLMDFVSAHRGALGRECMSSPAQFTHPLIVRAKGEIASAAIAAGKTPSHNVTIELGDPEQAFKDARRARQEFGFLRMWSVHPTQIEPILRGMRVEESELAFAIDVLLRAQRANWGPIRVGSELFDRASYRYLWDLVRRAVSEGAKITEEAKSAFFS